MNINQDGCRPYCWPRPWWWSVYPRDTPTERTSSLSFFRFRFCLYFHCEQTLRYYSTYTDQLLVCQVLFTLRKSERDIFDYCRCLMLTLNCILREPIWKRCRFRFFFRSNITEPSRYRLKVRITTVLRLTLTVPGFWWVSPRPGTGASRAEPGWPTSSSTTPDSTDSTSPGTHACPSLSWMLT